MGRLWFLVIFVYTSVCGAVEPKTVLCSTEMSPRLQGVLNLVKASVHLNLTPIAEWRAFTENENHSLPLAKKSKNISNLAVTQGMRTNYALLSPKEKQDLRSAISSFLDKEEHQLNQVKDISIEVRPVLAGKIMRQLKATFQVDAPAGRLIPGKIKGRPVYFGLFRKGNWDFLYLLLDPTNPNLSEQVRKIHSQTYRGEGGPQIQHAKIFEINGKNYLLSLDPTPGLYDLDDKGLRPFSEAGVQALENQQSLSDTFMIYNTSEGKKLLIGMHSADQLWEINMNRPEEKPRIHVAGHFFDFQENKIQDRTVFTFVSNKGEVLAYEPNVKNSTPEILYQPETNKIVLKPLLFHDQGKEFVLFFEADSHDYREPWRVGIVNRTTRQFEFFNQHARPRSNVHIHEGPNGPLAFFVSDNGFTIADLRSRQLTELGNKADSTTRLAPLPWKNKFLTWINEKTSLTVLDLENGHESTISTQRISPTDIQYFEDQGEIFGIVSSSNGLPYIFKMISHSEH